LLQPRAVIANVSSFNVQHRQNHAILTYKATLEQCVVSLFLS
jgi:hypothetical protein